MLDRDNRVKLLRDLADAFGPSGQEAEVRHVLKSYAPSAAEIGNDNLGSITFTLKGDAGTPRVMLAAHMDEIGFLISHISDEGFVRLESLGRWREQGLMSHSVMARGKKGDVFGIIGSVPPHIVSEEDKARSISLQDLFVDFGAANREELMNELGLREGDPAVPFTQSRVIGCSSLVAGKAWDNRAGCALLIETMQNLREHPNTLVAVGTAQEEVGRRGATTSANLVKPDICFVFEGILAGDYPGVSKHKAPAVLGKGPTIVFIDDSMIPNRRLLDTVIGVAEAEHISYQLVPARGGNDAGPIHLHNIGVPSIVVGVACRYIHSHIGVVDSRDLKTAGLLMSRVVEVLDRERVEWIKAWAQA